MTDIEKKALALVEAAVSAEQMRILPTYVDKAVLCEALFRAIEQHEAYKREVSDAVEELAVCVYDDSSSIVRRYMGRFIIAKPDPLVEALDSLGLERADEWAPDIRKALAARGLEIRKKQP